MATAIKRPTMTGRSGMLGKNRAPYPTSWRTVAATQALNPTRRPADRSVPLVMRQPETPAAMINRGAMLMIKFLPLSRVQKLGLEKPTARTIMEMMIMMA